MLFEMVPKRREIGRERALDPHSFTGHWMHKGERISVQTNTTKASPSDNIGGWPLLEKLEKNSLIVVIKLISVEWKSPVSGMNPDLIRAARLGPSFEKHRIGKLI